MSTFSKDKPWRTEESLNMKVPSGYTEMIGQTEEETEKAKHKMPALKPHIASLVEENIENAKAGRPLRTLTKSETKYMDRSYEADKKIKAKEAKREADILKEEEEYLHRLDRRSNEMLIQEHYVAIKKAEKAVPRHLRKESCSWARG